MIWFKHLEKEKCYKLFENINGRWVQCCIVLEWLIKEKTVQQIYDVLKYTVSENNRNKLLNKIKNIKGER